MEKWIVLAVVVIIFVAIVAKGIVKRRKGESSCGCGCGGCAMKDSCHPND